MVFVVVVLVVFVTGLVVFRAEVLLVVVFVAGAPFAY